MKITSSQYAKALIDSMEETPSDKKETVMGNFFELLVKNNALRQIGEILDFTEKLIKKEKGIEEASVVTAYPITEDIRGMITKKMESLTGRKIILKEIVDKNIIGGAIIRINDYLFDASIRSKIKRLGKEMSPF